MINTIWLGERIGSKFGYRGLYKLPFCNEVAVLIMIKEVLHE